MNILFWVLLLLMLLLAVVILIYPLLRVRRTESIAYKDSNLGLYDDKLAELEADLGEGRIDHEQYQQARVEIDRELLQDIPEESRETASLHYGAQLKRQPGLALMISVFLPMVALLVYMKLGMHAASTGVPHSQVQARAQAQPQSQQAGQAGSIEEMTRKLAERIQQQGGNLEEWTMLARAYKHMGQYAQSAEAFEQAVQMNPSAQLMLEQAEAIALGNNQQFTPQARSLVMRALELEPDNLNVLWFAGVAEFQAGNYRSSIEHLSRLSEQARQDPEIDRSLRLYIDKARSALLAAGEEVPGTDEIMGTTAASGDVATAVVAGGEASLQVKVGVSEDVRSRFAAGDAVFVYAKAAAGPKMPLAVQRLTLEQLPATITLDDSMAMMEGMSMSAFGSVVVSARVTKTGSAIAKAGDYIGQSEVEDVTKAELVEIQIDTMVQ